MATRREVLFTRSVDGSLVNSGSLPTWISYAKCDSAGSVISSTGPSFTNVSVGQYEFAVTLTSGQYVRGEIAVTSPAVGPYTYVEYNADYIEPPAGSDYTSAKAAFIDTAISSRLAASDYNPNGGGSGTSSSTTPVVRSVVGGCLLKDQVDILSPGGGVVRQTGVTVTGISASLFINNGLASYPLVDGTNITDSNVTPGSIFFNEISGSPGYYSVRFLPTIPGYWRLSFAVLNQLIIKEYDVLHNNSQTSSGLIASFTG